MNTKQDKDGPDPRVRPASTATPSSGWLATDGARVGRWVAGAWMAVPVAAEAQVYVSMTGSDASPDPRNPATPLATVTHAVAFANWDETIFVGPGTFTESGIVLDKNVNIMGDGPATTIIQGAASPGVAPDRIFTIDAGSQVRLGHLQVARGFAQGASGPDGGGIRNAGLTVAFDVWTVDNDAGSSGHGGGIYNAAGGSLTITNSTIDGNRAGDGPDNLSGDGGFGGSGGGLANLGLANVDRSTFLNNTAGGGGEGSNWGGDGGRGGGIFNAGTFQGHSLTLSGNACGPGGDGGSSGGFGGSGGGFDSTGFPFDLRFSTVVNNQAGAQGLPAGGDGWGGGGHNNSPSTGVLLDHVIIANNTVGPTGGGPDIGGTFNSAGWNLLEDITGATVMGTTTGNVTGSDPILGPLANNGGPTLTHELLPGSPAIDAGNPGLTAPLIDQRGSSRSPTVDIGAFESGGSFLPDSDGDGIPDVVDDDADGDGMRDSWELSNGLNPFDPADGAEDDDGDGRTNKDEHDFQTDPQDASSLPGITIVLTGPTTVVIEVVPVVPNQTYSLRTTDVFGNWDGVPGMTNLSTNDPVGSPLSFSDTVSSGKTFQAWDVCTHRHP